MDIHANVNFIKETDCSQFISSFQLQFSQKTVFEWILVRESHCIMIRDEFRTWRRSGVFIVSFEYISHLVLKFLLLTLNM